MSYTPKADHYGYDQLTFAVSDGEYTDTANIYIRITPTTDPPMAKSNTVTTNEDTPINITLEASDVDIDPAFVCELENGSGSCLISQSLTFTTSSASNGAVELIDNKNGLARYKPENDYYGPDSFTFSVYDGVYTATAMISIYVTPLCDDPPAILSGDSLSLTEDSAAVYTIIVNDPDSCTQCNPISFTITKGPAKGILSDYSGDLNSCESFAITYTATTNAWGDDLFKITVSDHQSTASIDVYITPVNDSPWISSFDNQAICEETTLSIPFTIS
ncbi:MAG: hypothetical protein OMM_14416, partial [Candidatus Magnetoglobus multicellularis str. Araruama]